MFHRITIIGFVGQDPQMRYTKDGTPVTNFSIATRQASARAQPSGGVEGAGRGLPDRLEGACFRYRKQERSTARTGS